MKSISSYTIQSLQDCDFHADSNRRLTPAAIIVQSVNGLRNCRNHPEKGDTKIAVCETYGQDWIKKRILKGFNQLFKANMNGLAIEVFSKFKCQTCQPADWNYWYKHYSSPLGRLGGA